MRLQGSCAARLDVTGMSEEDKSTWSLRCGARLGMRTHCFKDDSVVLLVISGGHAQRLSSAAMKTYVLKVSFLF